MDAASCFILGTEFVPADANEPSQLEVRLLKTAHSYKKQLPRTLFMAREQPSDSVAQEAKRQGIPVVLVPESEFLVFICEAREGFREQFG